MMRLNLSDPGGVDLDSAQAARGCCSQAIRYDQRKGLNTSRGNQRYGTGSGSDLYLASCHYPHLCEKFALSASRSDGLNLAVRFNAGKLVKTPPRRVATIEREQPMLGNTLAIVRQVRSSVATRRRNITRVYRGLKPTAKFTPVATRRRKCAVHAKIWVMSRPYLAPESDRVSKITLFYVARISSPTTWRRSRKLCNQPARRPARSHVRHFASCRSRGPMPASATLSTIH